MDRRDTLKALAAGTAVLGCRSATERIEMLARDAVLSVTPLGFPWKTRDPFLACMHHDDRYPAGTADMGPERALLAGRDMGQDFSRREGWSMYHGEVVPGFPQHPHRGFETVTVVRRGLLDHADSLGAAARYGEGDVQWLTAGAGIQHAEMFPLLRADRENPLELFQIWLNLPRERKMVAPHFSMLWSGNIPRHVVLDEEGRRAEITVIAGPLDGVTPAAAPPASWASQPGTDLAIWTLKLEPGARWTLPAAPGTNRTLYFFDGEGLHVAGRPIPARTQIDLLAEVAVPLRSEGAVEMMLLQGKPIGEPVVQYGPFVMNTKAEIQQAFEDYRRTRFGGWPWPAPDPVHGRGFERFARRPDGTTERPG